MRTRRVAIVGAGVAGLVAALELSRAGFAVTVLERQMAPGGKMRCVEAAGLDIDAGPTVFTMRWVFERIFADAGASLDAELGLRKLETIARHAWGPDNRLDLFASIERSAEAIGHFAGPVEARGFLDFCRRARAIYTTLEGPFIRSPQPSPVSLALGSGLKGIGDLWRIAPFTTMWRALADHFRDERLRQLFGRYATYCGSSPFLAPATLMLVAHVEQDGVWIIDGGMHRLATSLADLAVRNGAEFRYGCTVAEVAAFGGKVCGVRLESGETIYADAVIVNADTAAVAAGRFGPAIAGAVPPVKPGQRSLSALTFAMSARTSGFPLLRHNVFFSKNYSAEFDDIFECGRFPAEPTVYICAQDRDDLGAAPRERQERLLVLVNAPPLGDVRDFSQAEIDQCEERTFALLTRAGLAVDRKTATSVVTGPREFENLYPSTGGALYGPASHGWTASFMRPAARTKVPGLYLAGGSVHPGPGVPMAALSGWLAAAHLVVDQTSGSSFPMTGMPGGM